MNRIKRIEEMERCLDVSRKAVDAMVKAFDEYEAAQKDYRKLSDYYGSVRWMDDYEAGEAGKLPADLKRGVLSEDGIDSVLERFRDLEERIG